MQLDEVQPGDAPAIIKARADTAVTAERIRVIVQGVRWRRGVPALDPAPCGRFAVSFKGA